MPHFGHFSATIRNRPAKEVIIWKYAETQCWFLCIPATFVHHGPWPRCNKTFIYQIVNFSDFPESTVSLLKVLIMIHCTSLFIMYIYSPILVIWPSYSIHLQISYKSTGCTLYITCNNHVMYNKWTYVSYGNVISKLAENDACTKT